MIKLEKGNGNQLWCSSDKFFNQSKEASMTRSTTTSFIYSWLLALAICILVLSVVSCTCEDDSKPIPKPKPSNPIVISNPTASPTANPQPVIVNVNTNSNDNRLDQIEASIDSLNDNMNELSNRVLALEDEVIDIASTIELTLSKLNNLQSSIVSIGQSNTAQINALFNSMWNEINRLDLTINDYKNLSNDRYNELISYYSSLTTLVSSLSSTVNNHTQTIASIQLIVNNIQNSQLTVSQVNTIVNNVINGYMVFKQPCNQSMIHNEIVLVQGTKVYSYLINQCQDGGLSELKPNTVYNSTVGLVCKWSFSVVNNQVIFKQY